MTSALDWATAVTGNRGVVVIEHEPTAHNPCRDPLVRYVEPPDPFRGYYRTVKNPAAVAVELVADMLLCLDDQGLGTAALIIEPTWLASGVLDLSSDYLATVVDHVRVVGGLVIVDERESGMGRTGASWWASDVLDLRPDALIFGAPCAPLGSTMQRLSGAVATLDPPAAGECGYRLVTRAAAVGRMLHDRLHTLSERCEAVGQVRGEGLTWGLDLVENRKSRTPLPHVESALADLCGTTESLQLDVCGPYRNVVAFRVVGDLKVDELDRCLTSIEKTLQTTLTALTATAGG